MGRLGRAFVYSLQSSEEIRNFLGVITAKFVKVHISPARERKRETVEFREHGGTTNAIEIRCWVVSIECVIQYAWRTSQAGFRIFVQYMGARTGILQYRGHLECDRDASRW